jgi:hypothetical protein
MLIIKGSTIFVDARYSVNLAKTLAFMINYTPQSQLSLELFKHPFDQELDRNNRWVKMATVIPPARRSLQLRRFYFAVFSCHNKLLDS